MNISDSRPIFIGGYFKSGTSLLRALLGQHPDIASGLETHWFAIDPVAGHGRHGEPLDETVARLATFFGLDRDALADATRTADSGEAFLEALMRLHLAAQGKTRWAEKTPDNLCHVPRIFARWPDARFVHILRDPRDVYLSLANCGKADTPRAFAEKWSGWIAHAERDGRHAGADRFATVMYEDLVSAPEAVMRRVVAFLDAPWDPAVARFAGSRDEYDIVLRVTGKKSTTLESLAKPLFSDRVGLWRTGLDANEAEALDQALATCGGWDVYRRLHDASALAAAPAAG